MNEHDERRITTQFVKAMTLMCVRHGKMLEDLHAGIVPANQTGDYSEVMVTTPSGGRIPWTEPSHFDDKALRDMIRRIVNRLFNFQLRG